MRAAGWNLEVSINVGFPLQFDEGLWQQWLSPSTEFISRGILQLIVVSITLILHCKLY